MSISYKTHELNTLVKYIREKVYEMEPVVGDPTWDEQQRRRKLFPFEALEIIEKYQRYVIVLENEIQRLEKKIINS